MVCREVSRQISCLGVESVIEDEIAKERADAGIIQSREQGPTEATVAYFRDSGRLHFLGTCPTHARGILGRRDERT